MTSPNIAIETSLAPDWSAQRQAAQVALEELRRKRGLARLDGEAFDDRAIIQAEATLDALQVAEVEQTRRDREREALTRSELRKAKRDQLAEVQDRRLAAAEDAENACVGLLLALKTLMESSVEASSIINQLGYRQPFKLVVSDIEQRCSIRIAAILSGVCRSNSFGLINFPEGSASGNGRLIDGTRKSDSWREVEAACTSPAIQAVIDENEED